MASIIKQLFKEGYVGCSRWIPDNLQYEVFMGSKAYQVSNDSSDTDLYAWCIPPKEILFPHLRGLVRGFDKCPEFSSYQQHHIKFTKGTDYERFDYDVNIFNITDYFRLCEAGNPNMLDSLFISPLYVNLMTPIAQMVIERRGLFLSKRVIKTFKGYAQSQFPKLLGQAKENTKRAASIEQFGYDTKAAYHLARLLLECIDILEFQNIHWDNNSEILSSIRKGNFTYTEIVEYANNWISVVDECAKKTKLPDEPDHLALRQLLIDCLEHHYGNLSGLKADPTEAEQKLARIKDIVNG